ncbi:amino acid ABC transporter permease [Paludibacterium yongneupense]|uniref:amino acid ABC transporter permease n=1 Tax=Paludibacterium yongneupense TaxID=400061 RepID=UPI00040F0ED4|nr:amino acid ABC transporter permease [Paludibacterium yongneupense]
MIEFSIWTILQYLAQGLGWTLCLSLLAFVLGGAVGGGILLARIATYPLLRVFARGYIEFFQGTPLLMQLFMVFFGLSLLGRDVSPWVAAGFSLTLYSAAFLAEIWRGCVEAVDRGQWEAAASLAMSRWEQLRHVILPQALRHAVTPTVGFSVQIVKGTAVTSIIGMTELTKTGSILANATLQPFTIFGMVGLGYFLLCYPLSRLAHYLERKLNVLAAH